MSELLTTKQVAKLLHADVRTIQRKADKGGFPAGVCGRHGRYWLFDKEKLMTHIFTAKKH